jgi:hypothetical protein
MIPILEVQGYIAILIGLIIAIIKIYYCYTVYDTKFIIEILQMAVLTSSIWFIYAIKKSNRQLACQIMLPIIIYIITIVYLINKK